MTTKIGYLSEMQNTCGMPVPLRLQANALGISLEELLNSLNEDVTIRESLKRKPIKDD